MSVKEEVEVSNARFCDALGRRDFDQVAASFDADAVMLAPGAPPVNGPDGVRAHFEAAPAVSNAVMRTIKVEQIGDAIAEAGSYTMTVEIEGEEPFEDRGKYMAVHRRGEDGRLRLWFDTYHSDMAVEDAS